MARSKRHQLTVADYAVVALCPSLIVLLLASLVYFVVLCIYHGQYSSRLGYIWFMFILGAVGIARISIEQSRGYATGYAAVLGLATFVSLSRFQTFSGSAAALAPLVNLLLIATVWLLADRITYDCTLIDDDQDASGQGLLDGLSSRAGEVTGEAAMATAAPKRRRRGRQPGRTVLWLTAAALPLFGIGQFLLRSDPQLLSSAVFALAIYLFATLSLLVATSFLGIRRYLRQREVDMPANVSAAWLGGGVLMTALILALCFMLPQPGRMLANFELPAALQSADWLSPSRYGWGSEGAELGQHDAAASATPGEAERPAQSQGGGQRAGEPSGGEPAGEAEGQQGSGQAGNEQGGGEPQGGRAEERSGGRQQESEQTSGADRERTGSDSQSSQTADSDSSSASRDSQSSHSASQPQQDQPSSDADRGDEPSESSSNAAEQQPADAPPPQSAGSQPPTQPPPTPSPLSQFLPSLSGIIKLLIYGILLAILAAFLWLHRATLADFWRQLMAWLAGRGPAPTIATAAPQPAFLSASPRPFASFSNPLQSGADPRRAVVETFQAAEAWYREQGQPRRLDETPQEFAQRLRGVDAADRQALLRLTDAYNRIVYGGGGASQRDLQSVQLVWQSFKLKAPLQA